MSWYCDIAPGHPVHGPYHDGEYGLPKTGEADLLELLSLEIFQAGLSWEIVLKKREATVAAFDGFDVDTVAAYGKRDINRLLKNAGIIRNRLKIESIIANANTIQAMRDSHGGFAKWLAAHHPLSREDWTKLFKKTFRFTGGEIVNEFLMCIGYLPGAHREDCPMFKRMKKAGPPWMKVDPKVYGLCLILLMAMVVPAWAPAWAEDAGTPTLSRSDCEAVVRQSSLTHQAAPDVAHQPTAGVVHRSSPIRAPEEVRIPITLDLEKKYGIGTMGKYGADAPVGTVTFRGGQIYWGDTPLDGGDTAGVRAACKAAAILRAWSGCTRVSFSPAVSSTAG